MDEKFFNSLNDEMTDALTLLEQIKAIVDVTDDNFSCDTTIPKNIIDIIGAVSRLSSILYDKLNNIDTSLFKLYKRPNAEIMPVSE